MWRNYNMAQRDRSKIKASLEFKGFKTRNGDHDYYIYHTMAGKKTTIKTKISRGSSYKVYSDSLLSAMARQCKLTNGDLLKFIDCNLSQSDYEKNLSTLIPNPLV